MVKDKVCNMEIDENATKYKVYYEGKTYYFCSDSCKKDFSNNPEIYKYLAEKL